MGSIEVLSMSYTCDK